MYPRQLLLVRSTQPENRYGPFLPEILVSEGLTGFETIDLDQDAMPVSGSGDMVILTRCFLRDAEISALKNAVNAGTRLVCIQPSARLAAAFGWATAKHVLHPGWIKVRAGYPGNGLPLPTHVPVAAYKPEGDAGWTTVADAVGNDWNETGTPAAAVRRHGDGRIAFLFYDLPEAVARIRFGNPGLVSYQTTGVWGWPHAGDLFIGQVDERVKHLPTADLHGQFLAKILTDIAPYPLPRVWYYPEASHRSAAIFQSDDDSSTQAQFKELSDCLAAHGASGTFYLMRDTKLTEAIVADMRSKGHTFAPHVNAHWCKDEWYFDFARQLHEETAEFKQRFGKCSQSIQCHCAPWQGYQSWVPEFMKNGYRLLFAYLSLPLSNWQNYMCGSGRAMRFFDTSGVLHNCWQQPVSIYDDTTLIPLIKEHHAELIGGFEKFLDDAVSRTHTAVGMLSHPVSFATYSRPFMEPCFDRYVRAGMPIFNGDQWCEFLDRRSAVKIRSEMPHGGTSHFSVDNLRGRMALMVPVRHKSTAGGIARLDGKQIDGVVHRRLEQDYLYLQVDGDGRTHRLEVEGA